MKDPRVWDHRPWGGDEAGSDDDPVEVDRNGLEILGRDECLRLLATRSIGRIGLSSAALPTVLPVNFRLMGERILFRTGSGSKLDAATRNAVVAFEVDCIDLVEHSGWSVVVTGVARDMTEENMAPAERMRLARWAPYGGDRVVAISTDLVSGRRIVPGLTSERHLPTLASEEAAT